MLIRITFILLFTFLSYTTFAQDKATRKYFRNGHYFLEIGMFEKALDNFMYVYETDIDNANYNYLVAKCLFNLPKERAQAKPYLIVASRNINYTSVEYEIEEKSAPVQVYIMLGEIYHSEEELDSAEYYYSKYENVVRLKEDKDLARQKIKSVANARKLYQHHLPFAIENLGPTINSVHSDYNPVLSSDGNTMAYSSHIDSKDEILISRKVNGEWSEPENITQQIGSKGSVFTADISADGNKVYLIVIDNYGSDIYYTEFNGSKWSKMNPFDSKINSPYYETSFFINDAEDEVYFSSDSPESIGGLDIFYSKKDTKGKWEYPTNLGRRINTPFDEESPFLSENGEILFFSSNGHETMGGHDIFFSQKMGSDVWSEPINIGYPLNTTSNDLAYVALGEGNIAYIAKDIPGAYGLVDIYKIEISKELLFADKLSESFKIPDKFIHEIEETPEEAIVSIPPEPEPPVELAEVTEIEESITQEPVVAIAVVETAEDVKDYKEDIVVNNTEKKDVQSNIEETVVSEKDQKTVTRSEPIVQVIEYNSNSYTIQIMALKKPVPPEKFSNAGNVKRSDGDDGFSRYTVGVFQTAAEARKEYIRLRRIGYEKAFLRKIGTISNY